MANKKIILHVNIEIFLMMCFFPAALQVYVKINVFKKRANAMHDYGICMDGGIWAIF